MNFFKEIKRLMRKFLFLRIYRKDTPESTWKFYNLMKYFYKTEFKKRENFAKTFEKLKCIDKLNHDGFAILNLSDISKEKLFFDTLNKFKKNYDVNMFNKEDTSNFSKKYLIDYSFEFNNDVKIIADPFVAIAAKYLGTLPILDSFQIWFSPNIDDELIGSKLMHRDGEDFKQLKIFIPIEEVTLENGPLHIINKEESERIYQGLIDKKLTKRRNQKIDDKHIINFNPKIHKVLMKEDQCSIVDTCSCYHFGSRKSSKPRKLLFLHFTTAFSSKTPILRSYDSEKKFYSEKDKLVYGLQKKISNHNKKSIYLTI
jgi:hypothetical protein